MGVPIDEPARWDVIGNSNQDEEKQSTESGVAGVTSNAPSSPPPASTPTSHTTPTTNLVSQEPTEPSGGVAQVLEPEPEPKPIEVPVPKLEPPPEPEAKPEQPSVSCCTKDTIDTLNNIASTIGGINNEINSLEASTEREFKEKSACFNNPNYDPLKVGLEGHERLVDQCLDLHQKSIDSNNNSINSLKEQRAGWYQARDKILGSCPDCASAWDKLVQAYRDKGWPI
ncbi:MAG: hypothetical protein Q8N84_02485 [bacterium]|nr:hypothetical protein [bacterium]